MSGGVAVMNSSLKPVCSGHLTHHTAQARGAKEFEPAGRAGGEGMLLKRDENQWSNPVFHDLGLQAGAAAGSVAMVLVSNKATNPFKEENSFALTQCAAPTARD